MMRRWAILGAVSGGLAATLVHAPAAWLSAVVDGATDSWVQLLDPRGTVWKGDGHLRFGQGANDAEARVLPGRVSWLWGWDSGAVNLTLRAECCSQEGQHMRWAPGWGRLTLHLADGTSQWPAGLLAGFGAPWNTVQAEGELRVRTQGMSVEWSGARTRLQGQLQAEALAMASRLSILRPVGSYQVTLSAPAPDLPPELQLRTLEGPLRLEGSGQWTGTVWRFRGEASADPPSEAVLDNLLNILGRRQGSRSLLTWG